MTDGKIISVKRVDKEGNSIHKIVEDEKLKVGDSVMLTDYYLERIASKIPVVHGRVKNRVGTVLKVSDSGIHITVHFDGLAKKTRYTYHKDFLRKADILPMLEERQKQKNEKADISEKELREMGFLIDKKLPEETKEGIVELCKNCGHDKDDHMDKCSHFVKEDYSGKGFHTTCDCSNFESIEKSEPKQENPKPIIDCPSCGKAKIKADISLGMTVRKNESEKGYDVKIVNEKIEPLEECPKCKTQEKSKSEEDVVDRIARTIDPEGIFIGECEEAVKFMKKAKEKPLKRPLLFGLPRNDDRKGFLEKLRNDTKDLLFKQDLTVDEANKLTITLDKLILNLSNMSEEASDLAIGITGILSENFFNKAVEIETNEKKPLSTESKKFDSCRNCGHEIMFDKGSWYHNAKCYVDGFECQNPEPKREKPLNGIDVSKGYRIFPKQEINEINLCQADNCYNSSDHDCFCEDCEKQLCKSHANKDSHKCDGSIKGCHGMLGEKKPLKEIIDRLYNLNADISLVFIGLKKISKTEDMERINKTLGEIIKDLREVSL